MWAKMSTKQFCIMKKYLKTSSFFCNIFFLPCGRVDWFGCATHYKCGWFFSNKLQRIRGYIKIIFFQKVFNAIFSHFNFSHFWWILKKILFFSYQTQGVTTKGPSSGVRLGLCLSGSFPLPLQMTVLTHGHHFFHRGGEEFFLCVHGSKMAIGEVMFLAALAWVKRGEGQGEENF